MMLQALYDTEIQVVGDYVRITQQDEAGNEPEVVQFPIWSMDTILAQINIAIAQARAAEDK